MKKLKCCKKAIAQQRFASMATSGFSYGKSAAEWNVLLYLYWLGVGATPLRASRRTLAVSLKPSKLTENQMKKILIFLIIIFTSCYEKKNNSSHNEIIEVKNISLEDKVPIENVSYYKFIPDSVSNVNVDKFNIIESYQIEKNKFIFGNFNPINDKISNPDSENNYGTRFLLLNDKNEVKYKFKGVEDVYLYKPYFYKNNRNNKIIIVCHLAYEYFFGGDVYLFENEKIEYLGNIDIEGKYEETTLIDILKINENEDKTFFTFDSDSITYKPGNEDAYVKNNNIRYEYYNKELRIIK